MPVSVILLTFNSAATIERTLASVEGLSDDIHVVDSGSVDGTANICERRGVNFVEHAFENYGVQRNWAIDHLPVKYDWQLHLDADERLTPKLFNAIVSVTRDGAADGCAGFLIPRLTFFFGKPIKHGAMYPIWHLRLFRSGAGRCELRRYDQHFIVNGRLGKIPHPFIDDVRMSLSEWTSRHNRWSDAQAEELEAPTSAAGLVQANYKGSPVERKRALRNTYGRAPLFVRSILLFMYRYVVRGGFWTEVMV